MYDEIIVEFEILKSDNNILETLVKVVDIF